MTKPTAEQLAAREKASKETLWFLASKGSKAAKEAISKDGK